MLASQRIESVMDFSGEITDDELPTKRGAAPTLIEWMILSWVSGKCQCWINWKSFCHIELIAVMDVIDIIVLDD